MFELSAQKCEACRRDAPRVSDEELLELMRLIPGWKCVDRDGVLQLERIYKFKDFKLAWVFHGKVASMAEEEGHHPSLLLEWGKLTVTWWTFSIKGLHKNDFICAAKTDALLAE